MSTSLSVECVQASRRFLIEKRVKKKTNGSRKGQVRERKAIRYVNIDRSHQIKLTVSRHEK